MCTYKLNLLLLNSRYGDLEQRIIRSFIKEKIAEYWWFADMEILLFCLLEDGLIEDSKQTRQVGGLLQRRYTLTGKGTEYIAQWPSD